MLIFVQYVYNGKVNVRFFIIDNFLVELISVNVVIMFVGFEKRFRQLGIEMLKIVFFVSDGFLVMMGKIGCFVVKLRDKYCLMLFNIYCVCYRFVFVRIYFVVDIVEVGRVEINLR